MKDSKAYCIVQSTKVMRTVLCKAQRRSVECSLCEAVVEIAKYSAINVIDH